MATTNTNMRAIPVGDLPRNIHRTYLAVIATAITTVTISGGTPFSIPAGGVWAPIPAPINDMVIAGAGTIVEG